MRASFVPFNTIGETRPKSASIAQSRARVQGRPSTGGGRPGRVMSGPTLTSPRAPPHPRTIPHDAGPPNHRSPERAKQVVGFERGTRVVVNGRNSGTVRFNGETDFQEGVWLGVELDDEAGKNDGAVGGRRYFACVRRGMYGIFVRPDKVQRMFRATDGAGPPASARSAGHRVMATPPANVSGSMSERSQGHAAYLQQRGTPSWGTPISAASAAAWGERDAGTGDKISPRGPQYEAYEGERGAGTRAVNGSPTRAGTSLGGTPSTFEQKKLHTTLENERLRVRLGELEHAMETLKEENIILVGQKNALLWRIMEGEHSEASFRGRSPSPSPQNATQDMVQQLLERNGLADDGDSQETHKLRKLVALLKNQLRLSETRCEYFERQNKEVVRKLQTSQHIAKEQQSKVEDLLLEHEGLLQRQTAASHHGRQDLRHAAVSSPEASLLKKLQIDLRETREELAHVRDQKLQLELQFASMKAGGADPSTYLSERVAALSSEVNTLQGQSASLSTRLTATEKALGEKSALCIQQEKRLARAAKLQSRLERKLGVYSHWDLDDVSDGDDDVDVSPRTASRRAS